MGPRTAGPRSQAIQAITGHHARTIGHGEVGPGLAGKRRDQKRARKKCVVRREQSVKAGAQPRTAAQVNAVAKSEILVDVARLAASVRSVQLASQTGVVERSKWRHSLRISRQDGVATRCAVKKITVLILRIGREEIDRAGVARHPLVGKEIPSSPQINQ